jgi:hypothetical protein
MRFFAPPEKSSFAGRLLLARVKEGSIKVDIHLDKHQVCLSTVNASGNEELLIRIPIGVRLFKVKAKGGSFFYYEASDGFNIVPLFIPKGTDKDQKVQEVVLAVSPVPPRDPSAATEPAHLIELTAHELTLRISQAGLPAPPVPPRS